MKISMWILNDYLQEYHPVATIIDGSCSLRNVRILSESLSKSDSTVYLMNAGQYISGEYHKILCVHQRDMILLETDDMEEVFNKILDCFESYNYWDDQCQKLIQNNCTLDELMEASTSIVQDSVYVADSSHLLLSRIYPNRPVSYQSENKKKSISIKKRFGKREVYP
ncbi:hypothetical protein P261_02564 [Lachnospiraceae bacterium TWA4]|nr:hypothetical protein P261_02564 [Lachnospiraceae bacterium TWA4]